MTFDLKETVESLVLAIEHMGEIQDRATCEAIAAALISSYLVPVSVSDIEQALANVEESRQAIADSL